MFDAVQIKTYSVATVSQEFIIREQLNGLFKLLKKWSEIQCILKSYTVGCAKTVGFSFNIGFSLKFSCNESRLSGFIKNMKAPKK